MKRYDFSAYYLYFKEGYPVLPRLLTTTFVPEVPITQLLVLVDRWYHSEF
jgi:hypothetical protein